MKSQIVQWITKGGSQIGQPSKNGQRNSTLVKNNKQSFFPLPCKTFHMFKIERGWKAKLADGLPKMEVCVGMLNRPTFYKERKKGLNLC